MGLQEMDFLKMGIDVGVSDTGAKESQRKRRLKMLREAERWA